MRCFLLNRPTPPSHEFIDWCQEVQTVIPAPMKLDDFFRNHRDEPDQDKVLNIFLENIHGTVQDGIASVDFNQTMEAGQIVISGGEASNDHGLFRLCITQGVNGEFIVEDVSIRQLWIDNKSGYPIKIHLKRCWISTFALKRTERSTAQVEVRCDSTLIGHLEMQEGSLHSLIMDGGCILDVACPTPGEKSPVSGDVSFTSVFFPRDTKNYLLSGAQAYRSFRHHLMTLQNIQAANLIRSAELAVERETDHGINKLLGKLYELFSDHGSSTWRPIAWLLGFFFISFLVVFCVGGTVQGIPDGSMYTGWRSVLIEPGGGVWQALYLAFQPIINPLGLFSAKAFLVSKNGWIAFLLMVQGVLSPVFIALFIFAVRRRFRLHG